ncbi:MAG: hypothetical protein MJE66_15550 [Proteobacteria bacterium]|nr:hypothetical protein [Pseudomonadota bacterium]
MVRVFANDGVKEVELHLRLPAEASVADAVAQAAAGGEEDWIVTAVAVNGCDVPVELQEDLADYPLDGVQEIRLERRRPAEVARSNLAQSGRYALAVDEAIRRTVGHYRDGEIDAANRLCADLADSLSILVTALEAAGHVLGSPGEPLQGVGASLHPHLVRLVEAQGVQDWEQVAAALEDDIQPVVVNWVRSIDGVLATAPALGAQP